MNSTAQTANSTARYRTETTIWRASDRQFGTWERDAIALSPSGGLQLDSQAAHAGTDPYAQGAYRGGNFYNGGSFFVGEATSPIVIPEFPFSEAVPSWNA